MRKFYIYKITNTLDGKFYIGSTARSLEQRWEQHCSKHSRCKHLSNAIQKYGRDAFEKEILYEGFGDSGDQHKVEQTYLDDLPRNSRGQIDEKLCYNISVLAGGGLVGGTPEEHAKLCLQGRTPEEHANLSLQGRTPEEHSNLSHPPGSPFAGRPGTVTIDGKVFHFPSITSAAKFFMVNPGNLHQTADGKRNYTTSPTHGRISYVFD